MALQLGDGVLGLLYARVERLRHALVLVPDVGRARLQHGVHLTAQFHGELTSLSSTFQILLRELLPADRQRHATHTHTHTPIALPCVKQGIR